MGTRGVPPKYGGFETAVYEIGRRLVDAGHRVTVYCRNPGQTTTSFERMDLVNLPAIRHRSLETLSHTGLSTLHAVASRRPEVAFVFNAANAPYVPLLRATGIPVVMHLDGVESARAKWRGAGSWYFRHAERWAVRLADAVIADARAIAERVQQETGVKSEFIPYGAPITRPGHNRISELGLEPHRYHLVVARFEPENHVEEMVTGFVTSSASAPLVVVGGSPYSSGYTEQVRRAAGNDPRVRLTGPVWDQDLLDQLYGNALTYLHGHSVGGTNPSLLRAMGAGAPVLAYDVVFNREVTGGFARFFATAGDVAAHVAQVERDPAGARDVGERGRTHVSRHYSWDHVARDYEALARRLLEGSAAGRGGS